MSDNKAQTIIIVKKKAHHEGHHGGAWKVAYADFVTAMMALFIVLWLLSSDEKVKKAVGGYFQDPSGNGKQTGSTLAGAGEGILVKKDDMNQLKEKLLAALKQTVDFDKIKKHVQFTVTGEGLRIELLEDEAGVFFESGKVVPSDTGEGLIVNLAQELGKLPNKLYLEGHTDAKPFSDERTYTNWELSADRANAARRIMQDHGVRENQIGQVRGFADQRLRQTNDPKHPSNRRISIIVRYADMDDSEPPAPARKETLSAEKAPATGHGAAAHPEPVAHR